MKHRQVTLKAPYEQHPKSTWLQLIDIFPKKTRRGPGRNLLMGYINITFLRGFTTISQPKTVDPLKKCGNKRMSLENPIMMVRHRHEHWESYICKGLNLELVGLCFHSRPNITLPCGRIQLGYAWCLRHPKIWNTRSSCQSDPVSMEGIWHHHWIYTKTAWQQGRALTSVPWDLYLFVVENPVVVALSTIFMVNPTVFFWVKLDNCWVKSNLCWLTPGCFTKQTWCFDVNPGLINPDWLSWGLPPK